jgi:hypothetical protein
MGGKAQTREDDPGRVIFQRKFRKHHGEVEFNASNFSHRGKGRDFSKLGEP